MALPGAKSLEALAFYPQAIKNNRADHHHTLVILVYQQIIAPKS